MGRVLDRPVGDQERRAAADPGPVTTRRRHGGIRIALVIAATAGLALGGWLALRPTAHVQDVTAADDARSHTPEDTVGSPGALLPPLDSTATEDAPRRVLGDDRTGIAWLGTADDGSPAVFISVVDPVDGDLAALRELPELAPVASALRIVPTEYSLDDLLAYRDLVMAFAADTGPFGAGVGVTSLDSHGRPQLTIAVDPDDPRLAEIERILPDDLDIEAMGAGRRATG
jgi:hypothetical protein